ncbi:NADH dehydrogenase I subunit B protein [Salinisphaera shabanensis E1L3A]|uniref:NADH dehydrogenase I subunit B protein n=1 Tax=Salinisphaera shabanensis E1L3A TaxID=1033802 RepID=U2E6M8_9GAMM|nr:AAA family ATPase [Salinisphaera shabanensis]ERJ19416.1 NADH dehydrogenase I subunit B protein [Salinisphaera shabanensis E1L3A]
MELKPKSNTVESVAIQDLWNERDVELHLNSDVTFLIGENGTRKTTTINLLVAALTADLPTLDRIPFTKISIKLSSAADRTKPVIEIAKKHRKQMPFAEVSYRIRDTTSGPATDYSLDEFYDQFDIHKPGYRRRRRVYRQPDGTLIHRQAIERKSNEKSIYQHLRELTSVSWLSVHRSPVGTDPGGDSQKSAVDTKVDELSDRMIRYFSQLEKSASDLVNSFQKEIFFNLLADRNIPLTTADNSDDTIKQEKSSLSDIFEQFNLHHDQYSAKLEKHFSNYGKAAEKLQNDEPLKTLDIAAVILTSRIHSLVQEWTKMKARENKIHEPRTLFLNLINSFYKRKKLTISDQNEPVIETAKQKNIPLSYLSSGEKQIFIILGEALLQENRPSIYVADEPELSLHVAWQEKLVDSITSMNPNVQLFIATHSPDIVGRHSDKLIDMGQYFGDDESV